MMEAKLTAEGMDSFLKSFREISERITGNCMASALKVALNPVVNAYTANLQAHIGTEAPVIKRKNGAYGPRLRLCMTAASKVHKFPDGAYAGIVGPKSWSAPHAHLIERGTKLRKRLKIGGKFKFVEIQIQEGKKLPDVRTTGIMPAFWPLAKAGESAGPQCEAIFINEYASRVIAKGT